MRIESITRGAKPTAGRWLAAALMSVSCAAVAHAQSVVIVVCPTGERCAFHSAYSPTLSGQTSVKLLSATADQAHKPDVGRSGRLDSLPGLYKDPESGALRALTPNGALGDVVVPSKRGATGDSGVSAQWTIEYHDQPKSKTRVDVPSEQFVALLRNPQSTLGVVEFLKRMVESPRPHPRQQQLIAGGVAFTEKSPELQSWREGLKAVMRGSLDTFRNETDDPSRLEATLAAGVAAMRVYKQIVSDPHQDESLQKELSAQYQRLLERFAIAGAFSKAGMDDAFLEKLNQIGLARWSRPDLVDSVETSLQRSAEFHRQRAAEFFDAGQFGGAFDEAKLAASRSVCNEQIDGLYYKARIEYVNRNMIPSVPENSKKNKTYLQQIVRELQIPGPDAAKSGDGTEYIRKRIAEGEHLDKDYLPLQLKKAEFLKSVGEMMKSREVVTHVERHMTLGRMDADQWLKMDADLSRDLATLRQSSERKLKDQIASGSFTDALATALTGLKAEPDNPQFLYYSAIAAAVLRDDVQSKSLAKRYLQLLVPACGLDLKVRETIFDLYRRPAVDVAASERAGKIPNWVSGEFFAPGQSFYDPRSGSFNPRVLSSVLMTANNQTTATEFRWDGFLATSIQTSTGPVTGNRRIVLELEPVYDTERVYMTGIGPRANSAGQRRTQSLRYINSPDFDPSLAAKFTGAVLTKGWAGNPFFHPFLWDDVYLFDISYDSLGRIKEAVPVPPDMTRRVSPFSERLTFTWESNSNRLLAISGARYRREMTYDDRDRLVEEKITHPLGKGKIEYKYRGDSREIIRIECEDNFYDNGHRIVYLQPFVEK